MDEHGVSRRVSTACEQVWASGRHAVSTCTRRGGVRDTCIGRRHTAVLPPHHGGEVVVELRRDRPREPLHVGDDLLRERTPADGEPQMVAGSADGGGELGRLGGCEACGKCERAVCPWGREKGRGEGAGRARHGSTAERRAAARRCGASGARGGCEAHTQSGTRPCASAPASPLWRAPSSRGSPSRG